MTKSKQQPLREADTMGSDQGTWNQVTNFKSSIINFSGEYECAESYKVLLGHIID